jgi:prepilin-type N-terminal cleavage/methylation domain-containing protein
MRNQFNKAFSLIELSIVVLIIGILVAGVTSGSRLVSRLRIASAQNLTKGSPVSSMKDLLVWVEPTLDESFDATQAQQSYQITQWNDINPTTSTKYFFVRNQSSQITYEANGINGLPTIKFDGNTAIEGISGRTGALFLSRSTSISDIIALPAPIARMSIILVLKNNLISGGNVNYAFYNGNASVNPQNGWGYFLHFPLGKRTLYFPQIGGNWYQNNNTITRNPEILTVQYGGIGVGSLQVFVNGSTEPFPSNNWSSSVPANYFIIGNGNGTEIWNGFISEVIIFDRIINTEERKSIENYLGKKYSIKVS